MIKGICFDVGGTLVHFSRSGQWLAKLSQLVQMPIAELRPYAIKYFMTKDEPLKPLVEHFSLEIGYHCPDKIMELCQSQSSHAVVYPDTKETLQLLRQKGYAMGAISNAYPWNYISLQDMGLSDYFDHCTVYSFQTGMVKPDIEIFQHARLLLMLEPEELIFVGDSIASDMIGAKNDGWRTVYLDRVKENKERHPASDYVINQLTELFHILQ